MLRKKIEKNLWIQKIYIFIMTSSMNATFKSRYEYLKTILKQIKRVYKSHGTLPENFSPQQKSTIEITTSKVWIYSGLYNKNIEQFNQGLTRYMEASTEALSLSLSIMLVKGSEMSPLIENDESARRMGIQMKKEYDTYMRYKSLVFPN
jgi:hypothetical protein